MELIDRAYRAYYAQGYKVLKLWWKVRRPRTHGTQVMLWHDGKVLLTRSSYGSQYGAPGGYLQDGETGAEAASRELKEELQLEVSPERLGAPIIDVTHEWNGHLDRCEVFDLELTYAPEVQIDNREIVEAKFFTPEEALELNLFPLIRAAIHKKQKPASK